MSRVSNIGIDARKELCEALEYISQAVGSTMGPGGRPFGFEMVGTDNRFSTTFSKDGFTVLKSLKFSKPHWQAVLSYCKQASAASVVASGDGSTSSIVLANAVAKAVMESGARFPQAFARELEADAQRAIDAIKREAIKSEEAARLVALTSTNGDEELTDVVMDAIKSSSAFGTLLVEKNPQAKKRYNISKQDGYSNCRGYNYNPTYALSASENTASSKPVVWERPLVLLFNGALYTGGKEGQIQPILNAWQKKIEKEGNRNLVIVAFECSDEVCNELMVINRKSAAMGGPASFIVKPALTDEIQGQLQIMRDLAAYCGISEDKIIDGGNLRIMDDTYFGDCGKVSINLYSTAFLGRADNHWVEKRIEQNLSVIEESKDDYNKHRAMIRNGELAEGLVRVEIGAGHLPEIQERADRFDDASKAVKSCLTEGALPGGGCSYIRAATLALVHPALREALRGIHNHVLMNYGVEPSKEFEPGKGIGVKLEDDNCKVGNAMDFGVLDACETVCAVIKNGVALGVNIATIGGYSYGDIGREASMGDYL
jgi:chaperonin GroEL